MAYYLCDEHIIHRIHRNDSRKFLRKFYNYYLWVTLPSASFIQHLIAYLHFNLLPFACFSDYCNRLLVCSLLILFLLLLHASIPIFISSYSIHPLHVRIRILKLISIQNFSDWGWLNKLLSDISYDFYIHVNILWRENFHVIAYIFILLFVLLRSFQKYFQ